MAQQICPRCGSDNIEIKMYKENLGSQTITTSKSKYKEKGHGLLWWLFIGSWWWIIDLCMWICFFPLRLIMQLFKKKKYVGKSTSVSTTMHNVEYRSMCLCKDCGYNWDAAKRAPVSRPRSSDKGSRSAGSARRSLSSTSFSRLNAPTPDPDKEYTVHRCYTNRIYVPSDLISRSVRSQIKEDDQLALKKEPSNEYDKNAIAVYWHNTKIGYLYQNGLRDIIMEFWDKKWPVLVSFVEFSDNKSDKSAIAKFEFLIPVE